MKPRQSALLTLACLLAAFGAISADAAPIDVGDRRQLFLDRFFVEDARGVSLVVHPPRKTGEHNVRPDRPWEQGGLGPYSSVLWEDGVYKLWYHAMDAKLWHTSPTAGSICYATSTDGITWTKPDLGLVEYGGDRRNNIIVGHGAAGYRIGQDGMMVFIDPNAPPAERYRMVNRFSPDGEGKTEGVNLFSSADGIRWRLTHENIMSYHPEAKGHHLDSQNVIFWDPARRRYVSYVRRNLKDNESQGRAIARAESDRLGGFPMAQDMTVVLRPEPGDPLHGGAAVVDYYNSAAIRYPWADRAYLMFPQAYYHYTRTLREFTGENPTNAGPMDTRFAISRDGVAWERPDRRPWVPLGMKGEFDCHSVRLIHGIVPDTAGREMYLYYRGSDWLHGWDRDERNRRILIRVGVGGDRDLTPLSRIVLRRDGFMSARAGTELGSFTTPPLARNGERLLLNIDTSATGIARVACLDEAGRPLPGFSLEDCDLIHTANEISRAVSWRGKQRLPSATGVIRLRFELRETDLYAFQFAP